MGGEGGDGKGKEEKGKRGRGWEGRGRGPPFILDMPLHSLITFH